MADHAAGSMEDVLRAGAPEANAVGAPDGVPPLSYRHLGELAHRTVERLNAFGIGRGDRVATVLSNGPEAATATIGIAAGATMAPLNPAYRADEFHFYLTDLRASALVVEAGLASPAREVARQLDLPI